jgi:DNA-binding transcriptional ArsR family regulator
VATRTRDQSELSNQLGNLLRSPERVKALVLMQERPACAKDLQDELGLSLPTASHHMRELRKMGLIEHVRDVPRRGAVAHYYRTVLRPAWNDEDWGKLSTAERQQYAIWLLQILNLDVARALLAGTFNARPDTHSSCAKVLVDEQGRQKVHEILDDALREILKVEEDSNERMADSPVSPAQRVACGIICVDLPSSDVSHMDQANS